MRRLCTTPGVNTRQETAASGDAKFIFVRKLLDPFWYSIATVAELSRTVFDYFPQYPSDPRTVGMMHTASYSSATVVIFSPTV